MKIIEYISNTKCWSLWLKHYVIYDWEMYWSWEYEVKFFLITWWHFKKYNGLEYNKDCERVYNTYEIWEIKMSKFANLKKDWYTCIEIINYILNQENMETPKKMQSELGRTFRALVLFVLYTIVILVIWWAIWIKWYIADSTISEEEYLQNRNNILYE